MPPPGRAGLPRPRDGKMLLTMPEAPPAPLDVTTVAYRLAPPRPLRHIQRTLAVIVPFTITMEYRSMRYVQGDGLFPPKQCVCREADGATRGAIGARPISRRGRSDGRWRRGVRTLQRSESGAARSMANGTPHEEAGAVRRLRHWPRCEDEGLFGTRRRTLYVPWDGHTRCAVGMLAYPGVSSAVMSVGAERGQGGEFAA